MVVEGPEEVPHQVRFLTRRYFERSAVALAESLLGRMFIHDSADGLTGGRIVEVEAYRGGDDPASHAYRRMTDRNSVMFGPPGHLYVYFTYGMHHCANVVADLDGVPGAVLIRALEPMMGVDLMSQRRGTNDLAVLTKGPGRLCQAMGIGRLQNGIDLTAGKLWIDRSKRMKGEVRTSTRIGIPAELDQPWRFFEAGPWVSGPKLKPLG